MRGVFYVAMTFSVVVLANTYGGAIEGRFYPVISKAEIDRVEEVNSVSSRIWGRFDRLRDCSFQGLHFFLGEPGSSARVDLVFEEPAQVREPGSAEFGPWRVQLTHDQIENRAYAIAYHRCHPFWITETRFYP